MSIGERLRYARERAGLTLRQIVERTGIGESSLSEYETGKREPRLSQLHALAEVYCRSVSFFLDEGAVPREAVLWREKPEPAKATETEARFLELCQQYHNLELWCEDHRPYNLPLAEGSAASYAYHHAERLAANVRASLELGDRPGQSLLWVLEELCGVKVFHLGFEPSGAAACTVHETWGPAILLNSQNSRWRRNFDLAHELFHLLVWKVFRTSDAGDGFVASEREEKLATCFASNLLMPTYAVRPGLDEAISEGRIAFAALFDIARQFDVSVEALVWRMTFLRYFRFEDTPSIIERYRGVSTLWEDKREHDSPPDRPPRFRALAIRALGQGHMSLGRFSEYMGMSRKTARVYLEQDAQGDEEVQVAAP